MLKLSTLYERDMFLICKQRNAAQHVSVQIIWIPLELFQIDLIYHFLFCIDGSFLSFFNQTFTTLLFVYLEVRAI